MSSAIGCAQIERVEELISRKREIFSYYRERLTIYPSLTLNPERAGTVIGAWMPTVVFDPETGVTREKLQAAFVAENIDARVFFHPLSSLPMFEERLQNELSMSIPRSAINLPSFHDISPSEQSRVVDVIERLTND